jgi:hypothetical protein
MESWIRIRIKVKFKKLYRLNMEPWRAVDAYNGGMEAKNGAVESLWFSAADSHHFDEEQDPDPHYSETSYPDLH